eukprot:gene9124-8225_t
MDAACGGCPGDACGCTGTLAGETCPLACLAPGSTPDPDGALY